MVSEERIKSPPNPKHPSQKQSESAGNGENRDTLFSPGFKSVAAMAGWDEEALMIASLVVEDTPERESKHKKRSGLLNFKTPPTNSRRKRRAQRKSPGSIPVTILDLDEVEPAKDENEKKQQESKAEAHSNEESIKGESNEKGSSESSSCSAIPCIDRLREELSCAICLEICFEPSTTPCGHSFCKKCLRSAADKCGKKCPKCRQLFSNGRSCTVNTVLWNTIQLLFPQEVEARKAAGGLNSREAERKSSARASHYSARNRTVVALNSPESEERSSGRRNHHQSVRSRAPLRPNGGVSTRAAAVSMNRRRDLPPSQDEDAAFALRLQREEFMEAFRGSDEQYDRRTLTFARANLIAMASRAMDTRGRNRESCT